MIEDAELLRRYAEERSEGAFAALVRRRVGLVYSVAVRQCAGDAHLAEDVTQKVFTDLSRKARELAGRPVLSGWLYRSARFAAADVVRSERRRRAREEANALMDESWSGTADAGAADWEKLRPVLDEALAELGEDDHDAVALRFFEEKSFAEIGRRLEMSEDAARKRVSRAVGELQGLLARRGVTSTEAALALVLANQAAATVPAGLAASVTSGALAGVVGMGAAGAAGGVAIFMGMTKLQIGIAGALAVAGAAGYMAQGRTNEALRQEIAAVREQQQVAVALKAENQRLASFAAEVDVLRRDDGELKQLEQRVAEVKKASEEKARLAQAQARVQARRDESARRAEQDRLVQQEVDRMNREGNALVEAYKYLNAQAARLSGEERTQMEDRAKAALEDIRRKQAEVQAYIQAKQVELGGFVESKSVFRAGQLPGGWSSVPGVIAPSERGASTAPSVRDGTVKSVPQP